MPAVLVSAKALASLLLVSSSVAMADPKPCLVKEPVDGADARVTVTKTKVGLPERIEFCKAPGACKSFPLRGLEGSPPETPHVYMNRAGTLGAYRWLANDRRGWHHSLRLYDLAAGKTLHDLTKWKAGGWVWLLDDRMIVDHDIYDAAGKVLGTVDRAKHYPIVSPDEKLAVFVDTNDGAFVIVDLATAKPRHKGNLPNRKAGDASTDTRIAFASDGKTAWATFGTSSASIDVASGKTALGTAPSPCP